MKKNRYNSDETVQEILDVSSQLFSVKGYEKTSISDIVNNLDGLTRGAIYHHFKSKEAIIDAVVRRLIPKVSYFEKIASDTATNGLEKMQMMIIEMVANEEVIQAAKSGISMLENPKFFMMYVKYHSEVLAPKFEMFILEGNADGSLDVSYPKEVSEMIVLITSTWFLSSLFPDTKDTAQEKVDAANYLFKGIGIQLWNDDILRRIRERVMSNDRNETEKK